MRYISNGMKTYWEGARTKSVSNMVRVGVEVSNRRCKEHFDAFRGFEGGLTNPRSMNIDH